MAGNAWDMDSRIQAAIAWLITGSSEEAGVLCNIPGRTIREWMQKTWWEDVLAEAKGIKQKELDALWTGLIHKSTTELRKRLDAGDPVMMKTGDVRFMPVKAKDLAIITSIAVDKRALLRNQPTSRVERITIEEKLTRIGDRLEALDKETVEKEAQVEH